MFEIGKLLVVFGLVLVVLGAVFLVAGKTPLGRLPGDLVVRRDHFTFYFPVVSSIIISVVLSLVLWLIFRYRQ
jgi:heme/copper-type cytochrome/quinol oxidase subunit 2